jgi:glycine oxidase
MRDVVVVGGGVIGLSIAYELAGQGVDVTVLERGNFGQEASWAGAGILPPGNPQQAHTPQARLRAESCALWPTLSEQLRDQTGIDNGYRNCGGIEVRLHGPADQLSDEADDWQDEGVDVERLSRKQLVQCEPALNRDIVAGYRLPQLSQVRNPRHLKALLAGCADRGVELLSGKPVIGFDMQNGKIVSAKTPEESFSAGQFCVSGGAWSRRILLDLQIEIPLEPVRGQIVLLSMQPLPFRHVIQLGARYLVPRPDGRILIGSTEEHVGFEKKNTAGSVADLIAFATGLVPLLQHARYERAWSGLRPCSIDGLPYLGPVPGTENLTIAAGHFRAGLQLSPATALLMRQVILDQEPIIPLDTFSCDRHQTINISRLSVFRKSHSDNPNDE